MMAETMAASSEEDITQLVQWFEDAEEASDSARELSARDRDYKDGKQLTAAEKAELNKRGQPDIIINRILPKVNTLIGLEIQQRTDPKAYPRTPRDKKASEAATDALRYVEEHENLDDLFTNCVEELYIEGIEACEVHIKTTPNGNEIDIKQWHYDRVFYDPHSRKKDFSDAEYMGGVTWMDFDKAKRRWKSKEQISALEQTANETADAHYNDRPSWKTWAKGVHRKRVRIVQMYYRDGDKWVHCTYTKGGKLEGPTPVPYIDENGESDNPMIMQSAYVDRENNRYGEVRSMIGPQDEINKRRSKLLHLMNVRQTIGEKGAVDNVDQAKAELAKPDGHVDLNPGDWRFEIVDQSLQINGQAELLAEAKGEIENMGPNSALQGKGREDASGRAIIASQQGGIFEASPLTDRHRNFKLRVYKAIWNRIRQFWDEQRWIRVTDNEDNVQFVGFNRPVTVMDMMIREMEKQGADEEQARQMVMQLAQQQGIPPEELERVVTIENVPAEMDMDITIEAVPDTITIQQEQFEQLSQILPALPPNDPRLKILINASSLRNKKEIIEGMEEAFQQSPEQQMAAQVQMQSLVEDVRNKQADTAKKVAETEKIATDADKTEADIVRENFEMGMRVQDAAQAQQEGSGQ